MHILTIGVPPHHAVYLGESGHQNDHQWSRNDGHRILYLDVCGQLQKTRKFFECVRFVGKKNWHFHKARERYNSGVSQLNKRLLQRCANTLTREQEFSALEVVSYLMGWGDRYISHWFVTIYWNAVASLIRKTYPDMNVKRYVTVIIVVNFHSDHAQSINRK